MDETGCIMRICFTSFHNYLDFSSGAAISMREVCLDAARRGDVAFMIRQAPEFVKSLDEPTPVMVNGDVFHSWEISKRTSRTLVAQVHSVANSDNLKYSIHSGNERNWHSIDENTGDIYTTSQYDDDLANNAELMCSPTTLSVRV